jgi:glutathione S-transferase
MILYTYNISPYAAKVRAILRYKGLRFEERTVHPLKRGVLKELSGQKKVPVLDDGGRVIADSTRIARYLDDNYPEKPVIPSEPGLRARALLLEEWADEALARVVAPVRWLIPHNAKLTLAQFRSAYPPKQDVLWSVLGRALVLRAKHRYGTPGGPAAMLNRLAEVLELVDGALAETGWLAGPSPTVADFAAWGWLHVLENLDGWETLKAKRRVLKLVKAFGTSQMAPEAYDSDDAAMLDASHHRRAGVRKLPLV